MFGLFKKMTPVQRLEDKYKKLQEESFKLSHSNRRKSDEKAAEAEEIWKEIEKIKAQ